MLHGTHPHMATHSNILPLSGRDRVRSEPPSNAHTYAALRQTNQLGVAINHRLAQQSNKHDINVYKEREETVQGGREGKPTN